MQNKMTSEEIIAAAYDAGVVEEYNRLVSNPLSEAEFYLITELMKKYIPEGSVVIDIGAGPGRYAEYLLNLNCFVGLVDLSRKSLENFNTRISAKQKDNVLFSKVACATDLRFIDNEIADAVFLMGPLYHLTNCEERIKAISEAFRILKPGGLIFAVFMSTFEHNHSHQDEHVSICCPDYVKQLLRESITTISFQGYDVPQYRCIPETAVQSIEPYGCSTMHIRYIEGIGFKYSEKDLEKFNTAKSKEKLFSELHATCEIEEESGLSHQFLYVGRKKYHNCHLK